jgi:hypothetical protein
MDNQPIEANFFQEGQWLTEFVQPGNLEVINLYKGITSDRMTPEQIVAACRDWVASQVRYVRFVRGKMWIEGNISEQEDLWSPPGITIRVKVGNCANKSFVICSLLRNIFSEDEVYVVLGNLNSATPGGHAWVEVLINGNNYIVEGTQIAVPPLVSCSIANRYESVHYFNDKQLRTVPGKTVMVPFADAYSPWLKDYLDWAYIKGRGQK